MEVILEMLLASTQDVEVNEEVKKWGQTTLNTASVTIEDMASPEQKQTRNDAQTVKQKIARELSTDQNTADTKVICETSLVGSGEMLAELTKTDDDTKLEHNTIQASSITQINKQKQQWDEPREELIITTPVQDTTQAGISNLALKNQTPISTMAILNEFNMTSNSSSSKQ